MLLIILIFILLSFGFPIEIFSEKLIRTQEGKIIATGDVVVDYRNLLIFAHEIEYDPERRELFARGGIYIKSKDGRFEILGKQAFLDLKTETGYFIDAKGRFERFYFSAEKITKTEEEVLIVEKGDITTCPPNDKELKLCFFKARVSKRYVFSLGNTLEFFNVPIFFFPGLIFPVGERRTGFLPPMIGQNTYNNFIYIQPFFWAISRDKDATVTLDFRDRQAKGLWLEYRQAISLKERLYTRFSYYLEPEPPGEWWEGRDPQAFRRNRYRMELRLRLKNWKIGLDVPSDPYFFEDIYFSRRERSLPYTVSYVVYELKEKEYYFSFNLRNYYDLTSPDNRRTVSVLPEYTFYHSPRRIFGNVYVSLLTSFTNFFSKENISVKRLIFYPEFKIPSKVGRFYNYTEIRLINNMYFIESEEYDKVYTDVRINTYRIENRTPFVSHLKFRKFFLINTFETVYTYSPSNFNNPKLDTYDNVIRENKVGFRLNSSLKYAKRKIANLFAETGYNFLNYYNFPTDNTPVYRSLLPVRYILSVFPVENVSLTNDSVYDANLGILASSITTVSMKFKKKRYNFKTSGSYVVRRNAEKRIITDQYTVSASLKFKGLITGGSITKDNRTNKELFSRAFIGYEGSCWAVKLDFRKTYFGTEKGYINEVFLIFNVFNLRDFKLPLRRR